MTKRYGSDLVADLLNHYEIPYVAFNPGSSFRGLQDSIVNYTGNRPRIILCPHEKIAVNIGHGYAKASGRMMAVILHDVVGLLHAPNGIYYNYLDRVPLLLLGAGGPNDAAKRRPGIDWDHTAMLQGEAIRNYVKWDDNPMSAAAAVESFARGYRIALTEPGGPVYICYDSDFLESELKEEVPLPDRSLPALYTRLQAEGPAIQAAAEWLAGARQPVIVTDSLGRNPDAVSFLIELAELLAAPVIDLNSRMNFPNTHPLYTMEKKPLQAADVVLALDVRDLCGGLMEGSGKAARLAIPGNCRVIEMGMGDHWINGWSQHFQRYQPANLPILCDTGVALPELLAACRRAMAELPPGDASIRSERLEGCRSAYQAQRQQWQAEAWSKLEDSPLAPSVLVAEVWEAIRDKDWVLTANTANNWTHRLWNIDQPHHHPGKSLGTATQIGISLGVALAHRQTGKLVVDLQPDGDLMYDASALWVAAYNKIPMLVVMYNNRAYGNSWIHQLRVAKGRGRDESTASIATEINNPAPDFAAMARSFGWYAEGPVERASDFKASLARAIAVMEKEKRPVLVDALTKLNLGKAIE